MTEQSEDRRRYVEESILGHAILMIDLGPGKAKRPVTLGDLREEASWAYDRGYREGKAEGVLEGVERGDEDGYRRGYEQGVQQGRECGITEERRRKIQLDDVGAALRWRGVVEGAAAAAGISTLALVVSILFS